MFVCAKSVCQNVAVKAIVPLKNVTSLANRPFRTDNGKTAKKQSMRRRHLRSFVRAVKTKNPSRRCPGSAGSRCCAVRRTGTSAAGATRPAGLPAVNRPLNWAPARCGGRPCCPRGTPRAWAGRRGSCPSGRRSCRRASAACSRPRFAAAGPGFWGGEEKTIKCHGGSGTICFSAALNADVRLTAVSATLP